MIRSDIAQMIHVTKKQIVNFDISQVFILKWYLLSSSQSKNGFFNCILCKNEIGLFDTSYNMILPKLILPYSIVGQKETF